MRSLITRARIHIPCLASLVILAAMANCRSSAETNKEKATHAGKISPPQVYVVNYPLQYFAARMAGDAAEVVFPPPPDEDPAFWKPDVATIAAFQQADLILRNGASYARWADYATLPASKVVDTSSGFRDRYIAMEDAVQHAHGPNGEHAPAGTAFTTWLDPTLAARQVEAIRVCLVTLLPEKTAELNRNCENLISDLHALDARLQRIVKGHHERPLLTSAPVYQYFARRYQLNLKSMHWDPDEPPSDSQWSELDGLLEVHPAKWMIWEAPPQGETEEGLHRRGVSCIVFYPCGNSPPDGDYLQTMKDNIERLQAAFAAP